MADGFRYLQTRGILLCSECQTSLLPTRASQERHLRQPPHHLKGKQLHALLDLFVTYELQLPGQVALQDPPCTAINGLRRHSAFACCICGNDKEQQQSLTRSEPAIRAHVSKDHAQKPAQQIEGSSWRKCTVQTFFAETRHIRYFVVDEAVDQQQTSHGWAKTADDASLESLEKEFFELVDVDVAAAENDAKVEANIVHSFDNHRSAVIP